MPGAPLSNGKTFFVFTYIWKEDVLKISAVHRAPRNVSLAWSKTWLASLTIYCVPFFNNNSPPPCQFLRDNILLKKNQQRWSLRGHILKSLASKVKNLALASKPQVLENCSALGSRTAVFFEWLKFCRSAEKKI